MIRYKDMGGFLHKRQCVLALVCLFSLISGQTSAAWFEAQGQAVIQDGNREQARQQAIQEAIKQALLFAGASVRSVQTLTNGLLRNDELRISANGEVNNLELIDENWHQDYVSVRIRADIFASRSSCSAGSYQKTIATSYFPIQFREHTLDGQVQDLSESVVWQLQRQFNQGADTSTLNYVAPYTAQWMDPAVIQQAPDLARQSRTQFVLTGVITDLSIERPNHPALQFWKSDTPTRQFGVNISVIDGLNGARLMNKHYQMQAPWEYDRFSNVDVTSASFWHSHYGDALAELLGDVVTDVNETLHCQPVSGRVLQVLPDRMQVSLGRAQGIEVGDELVVYQTSQVKDPNGQTYLQYNLYPNRVKVVSAYVDTATVEAADNGILSNIQPNDFVARR